MHFLVRGVMVITHWDVNKLHSAVSFQQDCFLIAIKSIAIGSFHGIGCHFCECDSPSKYCECDILANFNPVFQET